MCSSAGKAEKCQFTSKGNQIMSRNQCFTETTQGSKISKHKETC